MEKLSQKLTKKIIYKTPYQQLAEEYKVGVNYVYGIARGERKAIRGKAKEIREKLEQMANN